MEEWEFLLRNKQCIFFLGAGVSAAAGIPTFREDPKRSILDDGGKKVLTLMEAMNFDFTWGPFLRNTKSKASLHLMKQHPPHFTSFWRGWTPYTLSKTVQL
jgi:NAD-dependent SIR2 family protein deacetylase